MHNNSPFHRQNRLVRSLLAVQLLPVKNHRIIADYTSRAFQFLFTKKLSFVIWHVSDDITITHLPLSLFCDTSFPCHGLTFVKVLPLSRSHLSHGLTFVTVLPSSRSYLCHGLYLGHGLTFAPSAPATPVFPVAPLLPCNIFFKAPAFFNFNDVIFKKNCKSELTFGPVCPPMPTVPLFPWRPWMRKTIGMHWKPRKRKSEIRPQLVKQCTIQERFLCHF